MMPSASAASVPGSGAIWTSHLSAVSDRYGSMATRRAPRRRASCARVQKCRFEVIALQPQNRMSRLDAICSTSVPMAAPIVATQPAFPAVAQMVRSSSDAPSRWKKRRSIELDWSSPIVPAYE